MLFIRDPYKKARNDLGHCVKLTSIEGAVVVDFSDTGIGKRATDDSWFGAHISLQPGAYVLQVPHFKGDSSTAHVIYCCSHWQTQSFLYAYCPKNDAVAVTVPSSLSILMSREGRGFDAGREDSKWTEMALRALRFKTNIPAGTRQGMLWEKFDNPLLGLYAGLLQLRRRECDLSFLNTVFGNLLSLLGPLPDVLSIGLALMHSNRHAIERFPKSLTDGNSYLTPPMLAESWRHIVAASVKNPSLVPYSSFTANIATRMIETGPWLSWSASVAPAPVAILTNESVFKSTGTLLTSMLSGTTIERIFKRASGTLFKKVLSDSVPENISLDIAIGKVLELVEKAHFDAQDLARRLGPLPFRILTLIAPSFDPLAGLCREFGVAETTTVTVETLVRRLSLPAGTIYSAVLELTDALRRHQQKETSSRRNKR